MKGTGGVTTPRKHLRLRVLGSYTYAFSPQTGMTDDEIQRIDRNVNGLYAKMERMTERLDEVESENERLRGRVAELERVVAPDPNGTDYQQLTREQKVFRVRQAILEEAEDGRGTAAMTYKDVLWLFNRKPSPGHAYQLMEAAAEADGFNYDDKTGEKRLTVDIDAVNDETLIHAVNKTVSQFPA